MNASLVCPARQNASPRNRRRPRPGSVGRLAAFVALAWALAASVCAAADIDRGRQLAELWCVSCHLVDAQGRSATEAPPFAGVARRPDFDAARLSYFLLDPHPKMPGMSLSRSEAADLAAYIGSLTR